MGTEDEVRRFLSEFKAKAKVFGILFRDERGKNAQTLLDLEILPKRREKILFELEPEDFVDGPIEDTLYHISDMWVFGKEIEKKEIYIKISMGRMGSGTICISFHVAEHKLKYKLKRNRYEQSNNK